MTGPDPRFFQAVELTTATYDRMAADYAGRNEGSTPFWDDRLQRFLDLLEDAEEQRPIPELGRPGDDITVEEYLNFLPVLDAGCGHGRDARALASHGQHVLAADLSQGMLDAAAERTARRLPKGSIRYAVMDLRRLELPDACCRGVWCSASLLHLPRRAATRAMGELARVSRPGAPLAFFLKQRREGEEAEGFYPYPGENPDHLTRFYAYYTPDEVQALVEGSGLEIIELTVSGEPGRHATDHAWICALARKP